MSLSLCDGSYKTELLILKVKLLNIGELKKNAKEKINKK